MNKNAEQHCSEKIYQACFINHVVSCSISLQQLCSFIEGKQYCWNNVVNNFRLLTIGGNVTGEFRDHILKTHSTMGHCAHCFVPK